MGRPLQTLSRLYTGSIDRVTTRPARDEDFENVLDIDRNLFLSLDYLQYNYHKYLKHPLRHCFVAECDNTIIGFVMLYVVDEGMSVVDQSLRVSPKHQGKGVASLLIDKGIQAVRLTQPSVQRLLWTSLDCVAIAKILHWNTALKLLSKRHMQLTRLPLTRLLSKEFGNLLETHHRKNYQPTETSLVTSRVDKDQMADFIGRIPEQERHLLLPGDIWIINYDPYGSYHGNFDLITKDYQTVLYMTEDTASDVSGDSCVSGAPYKLCALSFGTLMQVTSGHKLRVDFYHNASRVKDVRIPSLFVSHFIYQVAYMREQVGSKLESEVSLGGLCYDMENMDEFRKFLTTVELPLVGEGYKHCYCIELKL